MVVKEASSQAILAEAKFAAIDMAPGHKSRTKEREQGLEPWLRVGTVGKRRIQSSIRQGTASIFEVLHVAYRDPKVYLMSRLHCYFAGLLHSQWGCDVFALVTEKRVYGGGLYVFG